MKKIYCDHNATTPIHPEVLDVMGLYLKEEWGNPSSIHWAGRGPKKGIDEGREAVCKFLNCSPVELVFTASGSESDNLAIKGVAYSKKNKGNHIITTKVEHPAVLNTCKYLEREGFEVTYLGVDAEGMIDLEELKSAITDKTILITIMYANNETGVIFPVSEIGEIAKAARVTFHTDAVQAAGKLSLDVKTLNCDLLTISAHKIYGPKGIGALYIKRGTRVVPLVHGGHHERNRRGGTENVAAIAAFGKACEIAARDMESEGVRLSKLVKKLEDGILPVVPASKVNGLLDKRIFNTTNISFEFIEGESLLLNLDMLGVAASSGSACTSGSLEPSHVLTSMGIPPEASHGS
ncbi:MAG: aminotransferase class V-fold PLP-dependent enzyme, partial [Deltaproteobacteria bacterium]|nr:aminotransferase class V-fold PLP-dependent enzyme [Deltaproteobacteria bacterium]